MKGLKRDIKGTDTLKLIQKKEVPKGKIVTYARFVCDYREKKEEKNITRIMVGGDRIQDQEKVNTKTADLSTIKLLLNSMVSTTGGRFMTINIKKLLFEY